MANTDLQNFVSEAVDVVKFKLGEDNMDNN